MNKEMKPVIITTKHRGVFFGYMNSGDDLPASVKLKNPRNVVYWDSTRHGFLGLASMGPSNKCRIGPAAPPATFFDITCVVDVSEDAVKEFEAAPWK